MIHYTSYIWTYLCLPKCGEEAVEPGGSVSEDITGDISAMSF